MNAENQSIIVNGIPSNYKLITSNRLSELENNNATLSKVLDVFSRKKFYAEGDAFSRSLLGNLFPLQAQSNPDLLEKPTF